MFAAFSASSLFLNLLFALSPPLRGAEAGRASLPAALRVSVAGRPALDIGFDRLAAFDYVIVDAGTGAKKDEIAAASQHDQIPAWIHAYDGQRILLTGYMMPVRLEEGLARAFVMMKDTTTCCYGATPNMNDYVVVTMKGRPVACIPDTPVHVVGVLHVGEKREDGYLVSLFEMDGEQLVAGAN